MGKHKKQKKKHDRLTALMEMRHVLAAAAACFVRLFRVEIISRTWARSLYDSRYGLITHSTTGGYRRQLLWWHFEGCFFIAAPRVSRRGKTMEKSGLFRERKIKWRC
jgi:hypothetical protein